MDTETKEKLFGTFHDALTGLTIVRDLTDEEIAELEASRAETPQLDATDE